MRRVVARSFGLAALFLGVAILFGVRAYATGSDRIVFVRSGNIWMAHVNGTQERQLTNSGRDGAPSLSPDGKWVLYYSGKDKPNDWGQLYLQAVKGGGRKKFDIKGIQAAQDPSFSFDGNSFVFVGLGNMKAPAEGAKANATMSVISIDILNMTGRTILSYPNIQSDGGYVYDAPAYSPDGSLIAFQHNSETTNGFEVVDMKGKAVFRFPKEPTDHTVYRRPRFSPDGVHVLCYSPSTSEGTIDTIYLVDTKKGKKRKIAEGANPTFVEGGKAIIYEQWSNHWSNGTRPDLWYLRLGAPGCTPKKIIPNASQPSD